MGDSDASSNIFAGSAVAFDDPEVFNGVEVANACEARVPRPPGDAV
jgi:hypothetical protein